MKVLLFFIICFSFSALEASSLKEGERATFVAYNEEKGPIFRTSENRILLFIEGKVKEKSIPMENDKKLISAYEGVYVFEERKSSKNTRVTFYKDGKEKEILLPSKTSLVYSTLGNEYFYFSDNEQNRKIFKIDFEKGKVKETELNGYVEDYVDGYLYFSKSSPVEIEGGHYPNVDLYRFNVDSKELKKVVENISGEITVISQSGAYIYDAILNDGGFQPSIYHTKKDTFQTIDVPENFSSKPYYSFQEEAFVFYDPKTLEKFIIRP